MRAVAPFRSVSLACALVLCTSLPISARTIYVDDDANAPGDGSSWASAYPFLQDALIIAKSVEEPVEIRVAQGVYRPNQGLLPIVPPGTMSGRGGQPQSYPGVWPADQGREATFDLINGVTLKGGYAGSGAPDPNARDLELYETILSGDLNGDDVVVSDPRGLPDEPTRAENSYTVVTGSGVGATAVLDGVTITAGQHHGEYGGAGMYSAGSSPMVIDCRFLANSASAGGGGMMNLASSPTLIRCSFNANYGGSGSGMSNMPSVYTGRYSNPILTDCVFGNNCARSSGGAMFNGGGNCEFRHCAFYANQANGGGGGAVYFVGTEASMMSCTFFGNIAPYARACYAGGHATLSITNTIFRDGGDEIGASQNALAQVAYSNVQGGWAGQGNIGVDPLFAAPGYRDPNGTPDDPSDDFWVDGDYHLKSQAGRWNPNSGSWVIDDVTTPCIDAGDPHSPIGLEPFPNGGRINMGAYGSTLEASKSCFAESLCETIMAGDINGDCKVDFADLAILVDHWYEGGSE